MAKRSYVEDDRKTVKRSIQDRRVIEKFAEELGAEIKPERLLDGEVNPENIEAVARYRLVHPYEAENFSYALMYGEEAAAQVKLFVELPGAETQVYTGEISYNAGDIFNPASVVEMENQQGTEELDADKDLEIDRTNPGSAIADVD